MYRSHGYGRGGGSRPAGRCNGRRGTPRPCAGRASVAESQQGVWLWALNLLYCFGFLLRGWCRLLFAWLDCWYQRPTNVRGDAEVHHNRWIIPAVHAPFCSYWQARCPPPYLPPLYIYAPTRKSTTCRRPRRRRRPPPLLNSARSWRFPLSRPSTPPHPLPRQT